MIHDDAYKVLNDVIYHKYHISLVSKSVLKMKILEVSHDAPLVGHLGFLKTYRRVRERFSWKSLKNDVMDHVRTYLACQQNKLEHAHLGGLLQPLLIPD